jgi:Protein of unknown function (DUF1553)/Protein of unknown function (DUF1549)/PA14 domain/Planctomycete cytochrome C
VNGDYNANRKLFGKVVWQRSSLSGVGKTMAKRTRLAFLVLAGGALVVTAQWAGIFAQATAPQQTAKDGAGAAADKDFYEKEVLPVLTANCHKCHADGKAKGGFSMIDRAGLLKGGDTGPAVSFDRPETSLFLQAINHKGDITMPPSPAGKLAQKDIDVLTKWVKAGVPGIVEKAVGAAVAKGNQITDQDRSYWAYQSPKRPVVPAVKNKAWVRNPVDAFILAGLEAKGLEPASPADRLALCRRVYFDLIGLPPTPEQIDAFVNDPAPDAYERLVDQLLASPHYGEKWARHWMDLVRYGETNGFEFDNLKPMIWRYRDYLIEAFNKDMPYDRFVREQIAGDQLPKVTADSLIATCYYRVGQWDSGAADRTLQKYEVLDSIMSTTGQVFLGISIGCARCHNHKGDPILQSDYYRMLAFFHNITDYGASKTRPVMAPADRVNYDRLMKEKQQQEIELARQIYQLEQRFAVALAEKKGLKVSDLPNSDMIELTYRFYRDTWEKLPDFDSLLPEREGDIANNYFSLAPALHQDAMGLVFEGKLKVLQDGQYTFDLESTDGARLIIDGKTILDRPDKGKQTESKKVQLHAGLLSVRLEYFNTYAAAQLKLEWSGPGVDKRSLTDVAGKEMIDLADLISKHGAEAVSEKAVKQYAKLNDDLQHSRQTKPSEVGIQVSAISESGKAPTYLFIRGNPVARGDLMKPGFPEVLLPGKPSELKGSRLELADWLTDPQNPLTARVMVNRLWQHHFGRGIVPTPNDFGKFGEMPTHQELLDWLATEFVAKGWKIKEMHKLLMTSNAYRMSSRANDKGMKADPANMLFWRYNMRRLTSEEVRDTMLSVSGRLNLKMFGPSVMPPIPREVLAGQARPGAGWKVSSPEEAARRSVYVHIKRSLLVPILAQFDQADTDQSCPVRFTTTVPTQALGLLNDEFSNEQAKLLAQRLKKESPQSVEEQARRAIRLATGRTPTAAEVNKDVAFIKNLREQNNLGEMEALRFYCLMVLNTNEFMYLD